MPGRCHRRTDAHDRCQRRSRCGCARCRRRRTCTPALPAGTVPRCCRYRPRSILAWLVPIRSADKLSRRRSPRLPRSSMRPQHRWKPIYWDNQCAGYEARVPPGALPPDGVDAATATRHHRQRIEHRQVLSHRERLFGPDGAPHHQRSSRNPRLLAVEQRLRLRHRRRPLRLQPAALRPMRGDRSADLRRVGHDHQPAVLQPCAAGFPMPDARIRSRRPCRTAARRPSARAGPAGTRATRPMRTSRARWRISKPSAKPASTLTRASCRCSRVFTTPAPRSSSAWSIAATAAAPMRCPCSPT